MSENIDIRIREDGARVVSRNLNDVADSADRAEASVKGVNTTLAQTGKSVSSLDRLKRALDQSNISLYQAFDSSRVERFNQGLVQYRNGLMKHFEMISKGARASSNAIKSQIEVLTSAPIGMDTLNEYYRNQEKAHGEMIRSIVQNMAAQETAEAESSAKRLKIATAAIKEREGYERTYTGFWAAELDKRDALEVSLIASSAKNLKAMEVAEKSSNDKRLQDALNAINSRKSAEEAYTAWWSAEMKKRDGATAASNLRTAGQRSGMQAITAERLDRRLIAEPQGSSEMSKFYAAQATTNLGQKTALQTAEVQAMQRQMAMYSLLAPMMERNEMLNNGLAQSHSKVANAVATSTNNHKQWIASCKDAHTVARGLSGSLGTLWMTYGSILPLLAGAALGSAFVGAAKSSAEMSYQLQFVKSLGNESAESISKLRDQANALAKDGPYGPTEIANGYRILAQAGLSAADSLQAMPNVLNLATVGELGMDQAGLALVGTLNAFKLGIEQSAHVADLFAKASAASQASVEDLTQSMRYGSTVGTQYKQNVDETMAALALLAKVNITGTSAGTAYRNMLKEIYTPTKEVSAAWKELGITMEKSVKGPDGVEVKKVKSFVEVIDELRTKMNQLDEPSQVRLKGFLGGERGSKEMVAMLDLTEAQWKDFYSKIAIESEGFAKKVASDLNSTAQNEWKQALNTLEVELASAFNRMEPEFISVAQSLKSVFESPEFGNAVETIVRMTLKVAQAFIDFAPLIYNLAKAWLVLKAAQVGAGIASVMLSTYSAAVSLAGGLAAASGAMGPVAAGVTTLGPLLAALGGPLTIILGLLTAGAAAWLMWGRNSETASGKAIKSAEEKLKSLKDQEKYGGGQIGAERQELERLEQIYDLRNKTNGLDRAHVDEARKAVDVQQQLVTEMEKQQNAMMTPPKIVVPKIENPVGVNTWNAPTKTTKDGGPSGRLSKDDDALAKLQARLAASEKEYAVIAMTGEAQYKLNDGFQKSLEIRQKIEELESKSASGLKDKGLAARAEQLASLKEQLVVSEKLGAQIQQNEILKVNTKIEEEVRLTKLLPEQRDLENRYIQFRNELLSKGAVLDTADVEALREKVRLQHELNKVIAARDQFINKGADQQNKDFNAQLAGLNMAKQSEAWTPADNVVSKEAMLKNLGIDTESLKMSADSYTVTMQQMYDKILLMKQNGIISDQEVDAIKQQMMLNRLNGMGIETQGFLEHKNQQLNILDSHYQKLEALRSLDFINEETYQNAKAQLDVKSNQLRLENMNSFFGALSGLQSSSNKKLGAIGKAAAITQATMDGVNIVQKAYLSAPYPWSIANATAAGVVAAANVAKIAGLNFATGGEFKVGGSGGVDSKMVSFRASPGERVSIATPTQVRHGTEPGKGNSSGGSAAPTVLSPKIINVLDPAMVGDFMATPEGEQVLINVMRRNSDTIRQIGGA